MEQGGRKMQMTARSVAFDSIKLRYAGKKHARC